MAGALRGYVALVPNRFLSPEGWWFPSILNFAFDLAQGWIRLPLGEMLGQASCIHICLWELPLFKLRGFPSDSSRVPITWTFFFSPTQMIFLASEEGSGRCTTPDLQLKSVLWLRFSGWYASRIDGELPEMMVDKGTLIFGDVYGMDMVTILDIITKV